MPSRSAVTDTTVPFRDVRGHRWYQRVAISPNGRVVAVSCFFSLGTSDFTAYIQFIDILAGAYIGEPFSGHTPNESIQYLEFSHDGNLLFSKTNTDVLCWDAPSGSRVNGDNITISSGTIPLNNQTGWVEDIRGRKLWWLPPVNRGMYNVTDDGRMITADGTHVQMSFIDGTKAVQRLRERDKVVGGGPPVPPKD
jgi:WD40 repeat protein